ncbi:hypothetical protein M409DRAFT_68103 [Zasmidium cellare ATCC 36951]|uniref:Beta-lactamase-related domain-containing protein n=1 Tax=Zasmidium cellare ATCC 36951 TaxID=1080233 RepID=A0A6A6CDI5_ZASCE|nr:uncharacterized protein M409DRAFT_68103 [Zasmidium cellare ATCC 36951]KAF2164238.1 hypothetical protein M409DRAFT_68103 [Zasmidium cellare ATCC 36951]
MPFSTADVEAALRSIEQTYRGPAGSVAVVHEGQVWRRVWGFADMEKRIPMTSQVQLPICSISKQMVCLALVDVIRNPTPVMKQRGSEPEVQLATELLAILPQLDEIPGGRQLTLAQLHSMQSDDPFSLSLDAPRAIQRIKSLHFEPGTEMSYSNVNFYILGRILEKVAGQSLGQLLAERVFIKAGMATASLCPNTAGPPHPIVGYEGDEKHGYVPAVNRVEWSGDAGVVASLEDMIAYEQWLHKKWRNEDSIYRAVTEPPTFKDGSPACYAYGFVHGETAGKSWIGHGGALRGFRLQRLHVPSENLSVVVLFNHEGDSGSAAESIVKKLFKFEDPAASVETAVSEWNGSFLDEETQLLIKVTPGDAREILVTYLGEEKAKLVSSTVAQSRRTLATVEKDVIHVNRLRENKKLQGRRIDETSEMPPSSDYVGIFHSTDADSTFICNGNSTLMYGAFNGYLGKSPVSLMKYVGEDIFLLGQKRGLDAPAPGDWTVVFHRNGDGKVTGATVGCQLARNLRYERIS